MDGLQWKILWTNAWFGGTHHLGKISIMAGDQTLMFYLSFEAPNLFRGNQEVSRLEDGWDSDTTAEPTEILFIFLYDTWAWLYVYIIEGM